MRVRVKGKFQKDSRIKKESGLKKISASTVPEESWLDGRRIVEFGVLIKYLEKCSWCENRLSLCNIIGETRHGLGSIFTIKCGLCGKENAVLTGKRHCASPNTSSEKCFDINTKLAAGKNILNGPCDFYDKPILVSVAFICMTAM